MFFFAVHLASAASAQESKYTMGPLNINSVYGKFELKSSLRNSQLFNENYNNSKATKFSGKLDLTTNANLLHPNFLDFRFNVKLNPSTNKSNNIEIPDIAEVNSAEAIGYNATLFRKRMISIKQYYNYSHNYQFKENISNIESHDQTLGAILDVKTKSFPMQLSVSNTRSKNGKVDEEKNNLKQRKLNFNTFNSFTKKDKISISYSLQDYQNDLIYKSIQNKVSVFKLNGKYFFDDKKKYSSSTSLIQQNRVGDNKYANLNVSELVDVILPFRFNYSLGYHLNRTSGDFNVGISNDVNQNLSHQLFESLYSELSYKYRTYTHTNYDQSQSTSGFNIAYKKRIPKGYLNVKYSYSISDLDNVIKDSDVLVLNEEHHVDDGQIMMLNSANIVYESVVVTDQTETIIYAEGVDYLLLERNGFIEFQRIIGGEIQNNQLVYIDYVIEANSYSYTTVNKDFNITMLLFNNSLVLSYTNSDANYIDLLNVSHLPLDYFNRQSVNMKFKYKITNFGFEYVNNKSDIVPYQLYKYFIGANKSYNKFKFIVNASYNDYNIVNSDTRRVHLTLSGRLDYWPSRRISVKLYTSRNIQTQNIVKINFFTSRLSFNYNINKLEVSSGIDYYQRDYQNSKRDVIDFYFKLLRRF